MEKTGKMSNQKGILSLSREMMRQSYIKPLTGISIEQKSCWTFTIQVEIILKAAMYAVIQNRILNNVLSSINTLGRFLTPRAAGKQNP